MELSILEWIIFFFKYQYTTFLVEENNSGILLNIFSVRVVTVHETHRNISSKVSEEKDCCHENDIYIIYLYITSFWNSKKLSNKCQPFFQILTNCFSDKFEILRFKYYILLLYMYWNCFIRTTLLYHMQRFCINIWVLCLDYWLYSEQEKDVKVLATLFTSAI